MSESQGVVHVRNDSADGRAVASAQAAMARWHGRGYTVAPAPGDGAGHPYDTPCLACALAPAQRAALRAVADLEGRGQWWPTSDMVDAAPPAGANSTPALAPLHRAGLVRRAHYGRWYVYQLTRTGLAALNRGAHPDA